MVVTQLRGIHAFHSTHTHTAEAPDEPCEHKEGIDPGKARSRSNSLLGATHLTEIE